MRSSNNKRRERGQLGLATGKPTRQALESVPGQVKKCRHKKSGQSRYFSDWCPGRDSNSHDCSSVDFESTASTVPPPGLPSNCHRNFLREENYAISSLFVQCFIERYHKYGILFAVSTPFDLLTRIVLTNLSNKLNNPLPIRCLPRGINLCQRHHHKQSFGHSGVR